MKNLADIIKKPCDEEENEIAWNPHYPMRNYDKQEECKHTGFKLFLKCKCTLTLGENSLDEVIEILLKEKERLKGKRAKVVQLLDVKEKV